MSQSPTDQQVFIKIEPRVHCTVARVEGELAGGAIDTFHEVLGEHAVGASARLVLDLSCLRAVDSTGLSAMITLVARARMSGAMVVLVSLSPMVRGVLEVTRLNEWFDMCQDVDEAVARFS